MLGDRLRLKRRDMMRNLRAFHLVVGLAATAHGDSGRFEAMDDVQHGVGGQRARIACRDARAHLEAVGGRGVAASKCQLHAPLLL